MTWDAQPTHDTLKARAARSVAPGFSWCLRCGMPWKFVDEHATPYSETGACFPLCESCWTILGHCEARIPYYRTLVEQWERDKPVDRETYLGIQRAVAAGL